jgi:hypothetical protein
MRFSFEASGRGFFGVRATVLTLDSQWLLTAFTLAQLIYSDLKRTRVKIQLNSSREDVSRRKFYRELFQGARQYLERLSSYGVTFHSYTEPHLCVILLAVLATMAKQEQSGFPSVSLRGWPPPRAPKAASRSAGLGSMPIPNRSGWALRRRSPGR